MSFYPTSDPNKKRYEREKQLDKLAEERAEYYDDDDKGYNKDIKRRCGHLETYVKCLDEEDEVRQTKFLCYNCQEEALNKIAEEQESKEIYLEDRFL